MVSLVKKLVGLATLAGALNVGVAYGQELPKLQGSEQFINASISNLASVCVGNTRSEGAGVYNNGQQTVLWEKNQGNTATPAGILSNAEFNQEEVVNSSIGDRVAVVNGCDANTGKPVYIATASQKATDGYIVNSAMFGELPLNGENNGAVYFAYTGTEADIDLVKTTLGYKGGLTASEVQGYINSFTKQNPTIK